MHLIDYLPQLPPPVARYALHTLTEALPPPVTDLPEERAARDVAAVAAVAALRPADALEARLAAQAVAADAHVMDCLRLAGVVGRRCEEAAQRCRAQAATMGRLQHSALRALRLLQNGRDRRMKASPSRTFNRRGTTRQSRTRRRLTPTSSPRPSAMSRSTGSGPW